MADAFSYLLGVSYDPIDPCSFIKQYLPSPAYLNQVTQYLKDHPLFRALIMFYQYRGDRILNNYLRSGLFSAVNYLKGNKKGDCRNYFYLSTYPYIPRDSNDLQSI